MKCLKRKDLLFLDSKLMEKVLDPRNSKENYESFLRKTKTKNSKAIRNNYISVKTFLTVPI